jgi:hypothetical protein
MASKKIRCGILTSMLIFELMVLGCDDGSTNVDKEEEIPFPLTSGQFTFTDIPPKYDGKFVILVGYFSSDWMALIVGGYKGGTRNTSNSNYFSTMKCVKIENGSVEIPLYKFSRSSPASSIESYTGEDSMYVKIFVYDIEIVSADDIQNYNAVAIFGTEEDYFPKTFPVTFTNGKATESNNDAVKKI